MRKIPDWTVHSSHTQFCIYNVDTSLFDYLDFIIQPLDLRCWVHFIFTSHDVVLIITRVNFIYTNSPVDLLLLLLPPSLKKIG